MVEDSEMLACETETNVETADQPPMAHASTVPVFEADHVAEEPAIPDQPLEEDADLELRAAAESYRQGQAPGRSSRRSHGIAITVSAFLGIAFHVLLATGIWAVFHFGHLTTEAQAHFERGKGVPIGDISSEESHDAGGERQLPTRVAQAPAPQLPPALEPLTPPPDDPSLTSTAEVFASAEISRPDELTAPPPPIGVGAMPGASAMPIRRHKQPAPQPAQAVLAAATQPANPKNSADSSGGNPNPVATSAGPAARPHVRTHPGAGGTGGSGGSANGLDGRGLPIPDYPTESRRRREEGTVLLEVEVRADGTAGNVRVIQDAGFPRLADAAVDAIRRGHFTPATDDGHPIPDKLLVPYRFELR